jgi:LPXTG-motif cell wall-anchored protein
MTVVVVKKASVVLACAILVFFQLIGFSHRAQAQTMNNAVMISVQDQSGKDIIPLTPVSITDGESAFDILKKAADINNVDLVSHNTSYGEQIDSIGGITPVWDATDASKHFYWGFFINGAFSNVGSSSYSVKPGDDLDFRVINDHPAMIQATVSIEGDGVSTKYQNKSVSIVDGSTAYDAIKQAYSDSVINAPIDNQYFAYIANIDSLVKDGQYFGVYFNNQFADTGVSSYKVKNGDAIVLKVTGTATGNGNEGSSGNDGTGDQTAPVTPVSKDELSKDINKAVQNILQNGVDETTEAIALRQSGQKLPQSFIDTLAKELQENNGQYRNVTDYENMVLGITAAGGDATHFAGHNLVKSIYNNTRMINQGNNGPIYALLALDSGQYKVAANATWTREKLVDYLVKSQLNDGSWALFGNTGSPDITGMALSALAPYQSDSKVTAAIKQAVTWLSNMQNKNGGFGVASNGGDSSESTAQVIIGLTAVGENPAGNQFTKADGNLITHLLSFQQKDGGFSHLLADKKSNAMATSQALMALSAYHNFLNHKGAVYQFDNAGMSVTPSQTGHSLPNTATNSYNLIVFGMVLVLIGSFILIFFVFRRRKA